MRGPLEPTIYFGVSQVKIGALKVARTRDSAFPSYEAFLRLASGTWSDLPELLLAFSQSHLEYANVGPLLSASTRVEAQPRPSRTASKRVVGYVYLASHGRDYKIGRSSDVARRRREVSLLCLQTFNTCISSKWTTRRVSSLTGIVGFLIVECAASGSA